MLDQKQIAKCYQPLFDLMSNEHGLTLLVSEMDEIRNAVEDVNEKLDYIFNTCDVEGCHNKPSSGGSYWRETGYWDICLEHGDKARKGLPQPQMKQLAIEREKVRQEDGRLPENFYNY